MHGACFHFWDYEMRRPGWPHASHRWGGRPRAHSDAWAELLSDWWRGPTPRAERGVVRYLILDAIRSQPRHGYEIIQAIVDKSGGAYKPSPGVVYPTLQMLEEMRLARTVAQEDRKVYEITKDGLRELEQHNDDVADFYESQASPWETQAEDVVQVMKRVGQLMKAFKRGAHHGRLGRAKMRKVLGILDDALNKLHALLAEDDE